MRVLACLIVMLLMKWLIHYEAACPNGCVFSLRKPHPKPWQVPGSKLTEYGLYLKQPPHLSRIYASTHWPAAR